MTYKCLFSIRQNGDIPSPALTNVYLRGIHEPDDSNDILCEEKWNGKGYYQPKNGTYGSITITDNKAPENTYLVFIGTEIYGTIDIGKNTDNASAMSSNGISDFDTAVSNNSDVQDAFKKSSDTLDDITDGTTYVKSENNYSDTEKAKVADSFQKSSDTLDDIADGTTYMKSENNYSDTEKGKVADSFQKSSDTLDDIADGTTYVKSENNYSDADKTKVSNCPSDTQSELDKKADKVSGATANNLAKFDANGNLSDSGIGSNDVVDISSNQKMANKGFRTDTNKCYLYDYSGGLGNERTAYFDISNMDGGESRTLKILAPGNDGGTVEIVDTESPQTLKSKTVEADSFVIKKSGDPNAKMDFDVSDCTAQRTLTMPDADVDLSILNKFVTGTATIVDGESSVIVSITGVTTSSVVVVSSNDSSNIVALAAVPSTDSIRIHRSGTSGALNVSYFVRK